MTYSQDEQPEDDQVSQLLQPYVDGELDEAESERVARHLESSAQARQYVREQQEVRTLLQELETAPAPAHLRARILAELDQVDAERATAAGGGGGRLVRLRAAFRGAMIMMPAAAAAVGLFFVVKSGALVGNDGTALQGNTAALVERAASPDGATAPRRTTTGPEAAAIASAHGEDAPSTDAPAPGLDLDGIDFPREFAAPANLPEGVRLVSTSRASADNAVGDTLTVEYVDRASGARFIDLQRSSASTTGQPEGDIAWLDRGSTYMLGRDAAGRPLVRFDDGPVRHVLRHRGNAQAEVGGPVSAEDPAFAQLLDLARAIDRR